MKYYDDNGKEITELVGVDVGDKKFNVPKELFEFLKTYRDSTKAEVKSELEKKDSDLLELKNKFDEIIKEKTLKEQEALKAAKEKEQVELAKTGELSALKESISAEWAEKIKNVEMERESLKSKILDSEIKNTITNFENVNRDALDDIFLKIKTQNPTLTENGIVVGDKDLGTFAKSVIESKDYYRVVKLPVGTGVGTKSTKVEITDTRTTLEKIADGMKTN